MRSGTYVFLAETLRGFPAGRVGVLMETIADGETFATVRLSDGMKPIRNVPVDIIRPLPTDANERLVEFGNELDNGDTVFRIMFDQTTNLLSYTSNKVDPFQTEVELYQTTADEVSTLATGTGTTGDTTSRLAGLEIGCAVQVAGYDGPRYVIGFDDITVTLDDLSEVATGDIDKIVLGSFQPDIIRNLIAAKVDQLNQLDDALSSYSV